jgi:hypothetical protein
VKALQPSVVWAFEMFVCSVCFSLDVCKNFRDVMKFGVS